MGLLVYNASMRRTLWVLAGSLAGAGCSSGGGHGGTIDAAPAIDAAVDAPPDVPPDAPVDATCDETLLTGGAPLATQGWTLTTISPATVTDDPTTDYVAIQTSTPAGGQSGGQALVVRAQALQPGQPFKLQVIMLVQAVNPHNQLDSAAAIMASFTPSVGNPTDRSEMIYLDAAKVGWADDSKPGFAFNVLDGNYHTYVLAVDAAGNAQLTVDGAAAVTRTNFTTNGTIAIGDQTNDPNVDSTLRVRSVIKLCTN
jgi:hypothetical protein